MMYLHRKRADQQGTSGMNSPLSMKERRCAGRTRLHAALGGSVLSRKIEGEHPVEDGAEKADNSEGSFVCALLDTVRALVVVLDRRGRIVQFNKAGEEATGHTFAEVKDRYVWDLFLEFDEVEPFKAHFGRIVAGQFPCEYESPWLKRDGARMEVAWSNTAVLDEAGAVKLVVATGIDITEKRSTEEALRESEKRFHTVSALVSDGIIILNDRGSIHFWNQQAEEIFGHSVNSVLGKRLHPQLGPKSQARRVSSESADGGLGSNGRSFQKNVQWVGLEEGGGALKRRLALSWRRVNGAGETIGVVRNRGGRP